ncbi:CpsD/CapB family tyrosine-protein kinase [Gilvimarinus sp. SDUM040013]|uniref:non-specific protein-tyrosine kinase n=1 Tax=Gilvimarinus gilvus TaxID=3058038 RepID=A0ABU4RVK1_9GAMM|nr:CpsD/CapB family tyrosine-protein kinase [Gilvimarinus sp. SDUM040013]MDO3386839.1 CpsD/CapB family tyrosine-protein kinase [Gilvimarinus sp. SDUM040013]MDX6848231.1 CpsD/CapB family tyrosine-protein kinase [Gilvimarinus sp. SDUM040013]
MTKQKPAKQSYAELFLQRNAAQADHSHPSHSYAAEWLDQNGHRHNAPEADALSDGSNAPNHVEPESRIAQEDEALSDSSKAPDHVEPEPQIEPEAEALPDSANAPDHANFDPQAEQEDAAEDGQNETRDARLSLSKHTERQLERNRRELGMIRGNLASAADNPRLIYVSSCFDGEGKTTCSLNAAYGLSVAGAGRVLLVDGNTNHPRLHELFSCPSTPGLVDVLDGKVELEQALVATRYSELDFLAIGDSLSAGPNIVSSERMKSFLDTAKPLYDYIIVDGASIFSSSEATQMAPLFDGMILTVACEQTKWEVVQSAEDKVRNAEGKLLGVALNKRKFHIPKRIYKWLTR